jgi:drug/metabolite transporter (DMT)-like permease
MRFDVGVTDELDDETLVPYPVPVVVRTNRWWTGGGAGGSVVGLAWVISDPSGPGIVLALVGGAALAIGIALNL